MKADEDYAELKRRALWLSDMEEVVTVMQKISNLPVGLDGTLTYYRDDGEALADIWWDAESDSWLCNWKRGSGA